MKRVLVIGIVMIVIASSLSADLSREFLCEKTRGQIILNISNSILINEILSQTNIGVDNGILEYYKNNWENICSSSLHLVLNPEPLCKRIYYLVLNTDYGYSEKDLISLSKDFNISRSVTENYLENYTDLCLGYSNPLPQKQFSKTTFNPNVNTCDLSKEGFFNITIPFINFYIGNRTCERIDFWNNFFVFEEYEGQYNFVGIRGFWIIILFGILLLIGLFLVIRSARKTDKTIDKIYKEYGIS